MDPWHSHRHRDFEVAGAGLYRAAPAEVMKRSELAVSACKQGGGSNCFVVPESVRCSVWTLEHRK